MRLVKVDVIPRYFATFIALDNSEHTIEVTREFFEASQLMSPTSEESHYSTPRGVPSQRSHAELDEGEFFEEVQPRVEDGSEDEDGDEDSVGLEGTPQL